MNKNEDDRIYYELFEDLSNNVTLAPKRKLLLTRMLQISPSEHDITYRMIGKELLKSGQVQKSILSFRKATIINPHCYLAQTDLVEVLLRLNKEDEAFSSIKKGLSFNPSDSNLHNFFIQTLEERHRLKDLEAFLEEIVDMIKNPNVIPDFYFASAEILAHCEKFSQALVIYRKAFIESGLPLTYDQHYHYGLVLYHEGLFGKALVQFERVKELQPNVKQAWNSVAHMNYCLGKVEKAREEFEEIMRNEMEINLTYSNFLLVLLHLNESEEVINQYKALIEPFIGSYGITLQSLYKQELKITHRILEKDDLDEKTREFNTKKLEGIDFVLSFVIERKAILDGER